MSTRTLQLWPQGQSITVSGEYPHFRIHDGDVSRPATPEECRQIQANELAQRYLEHEVFCMDSCLVSDLIEKEFEGFGVDDIENVYRDTSEWTLTECRDFIREHGSNEWSDAPNPWEMSREEIVDALTAASIECRDDESDDVLRDALIANIDDETIDGLDDWRRAARELSEDNPQEAYEWRRVSQWLCNQLRDLGEIVIDNGYGEWWGRGCTGQAVLMDGTLQKIALTQLD